MLVVLVRYLVRCYKEEMKPGRTGPFANRNEKRRWKRIQKCGAIRVRKIHCFYIKEL